MFSAKEFNDQIYEAPHGEPRLKLLANAIAAADEASESRWQLQYRLDYIEESTFHDDNYKAIVSFPELLKLFDEHPELEDDYCDDVMQAFKWVLENTFDFYQISREEIERYFDEFEKRCKKYGHSLRVFYMKKCKFYLMADMDKVPENYEAFHRFKRGINSDCEACEMSFDMKVALALGKEEEALRIAQPLLRGEKHCAEVPHCTYGELAEHYLYKGDIAEAHFYGTQCERLIGTDAVFLTEMGILLELYSAADAQHGWTLFKQSLGQFLACRNPLMKMHYARGAYRLVKVIADGTKDSPDGAYSTSAVLRSLPLTFTDKGVSLYEVSDWFFAQAKDQCEKLDKRNESTRYTDLLNTDLQAASESFVPEHHRTQHGIVPKQRAVFAVTLPADKKPSMEELKERVHFPEGTEVLTCTAEEQQLFLVVRRDGIVTEYVLAAQELPPGMPARPVAGMRNETFGEMMDVAQKYMLSMEYGSDPMLDMHDAMQLLYQLFPDMLGLVDMRTWHAYPRNWVRFAAAYEHGVSPDDMFGLFISSSEETGEIEMTTTGLCALGLRELVISGTNEENYGDFAELLDFAAKAAVVQNMLPDAGTAFGSFRVGVKELAFTWTDVADCGEQHNRDISEEQGLPSGFLLVQTADGAAVLPTDYELLTEKETQFPSIHKDFLRKIQLAKETYGVLEELMQQPFERAAVRLEYIMSDDMADEYGYSIELLWGDAFLKDGKIIQKVGETAETLPDIHEGDETEVQPDAVADWFIQPKGSERTYGCQTLFYLWEEDEA